MEQLVNWIVGLVGQWGYPGIVVMMFLESSCFPFPSEVVMIPAGYLSSPGYLNSSTYQAGHEMNFWLAIGMGIIGSWLGALFNYYLALWLGRPLLLKWGKYFLISAKSFEKGETFFRNHGELGTFTGRLIPVVRQYISLPAGIARMNLARFLFYTGLGAGIWMIVLTWIGYIAGQSEDLWRPYLHRATVAAVIGCGVLIAIYTWVHQKKKKTHAQHGHNPRTP